MIIDSHTQFSAAQAITATAASTNIYNTGAAADVGNGLPLELQCNIDEAFNNLTSLAITKQSATDAAFTTPVGHGTDTVLLAGLALNANIELTPWPRGLNQYLRMLYTVTGAAPTTGKITTEVVLDKQGNTPTSDFS